jgi:hypothetical protein
MTTTKVLVPSVCFYGTFMLRSIGRGTELSQYLSIQHRKLLESAAHLGLVMKD